MIYVIIYKLYYKLYLINILLFYLLLIHFHSFSFQLVTMISSYRLGDLVLLALTHDEENELLTDYPNSFGSKFIMEKRNNVNNLSKIDMITKIVTENMDQHLSALPSNIEESTVVHLRLGDVVAGHTGHEMSKRPLKPSYLKSLLADDTNPKYVIGKCFFARTSSTNYDECVQLSNQYLQSTLDELQAGHFNSDNADVDICCAVKSKKFVQGRGYFSKMIVEIRKRLNLECVETSTDDANQPNTMSNTDYSNSKPAPGPTMRMTFS